MEYIAKENEEAARKISDYIHARVESLQEQPHQGRPGRVFGTRELLIEKYPYIVPYTVRESEILVLRVFHTSQKPPKRW